MSFRFNFKRKDLDNGNSSYNPRVPVTLIHSGKSKEIVGVLDTGSDLIYVPKDLAEYFEVELSKKSFTAKTPNSEFNYKTGTLQIEIKKGHESFRDNFQIVVSENSNYNELILGVPFLSCFTVTFDYQNEKIILAKAVKRLNSIK